MSKFQKLTNQFDELNIDALLITSPYNRRYMTGFTGTAGVALITKQEKVFVTDFRYTEQATEQAKGFTIIEHQQSIEQAIDEQIKRLNVKRLGFEKNHVTFAEYERFREKVHANFVPVHDVIEQIRMIKTAEEITIMKAAAKIADKAFEHILSYIKPGVREIEIANELEFFMRKQGATSSSFDIIVASGYRSALPHGVASEKKIQNGELVTMDFGAVYKGYCSDITRTVAVGEVDGQLRKIYDIVLEAQLNGVNNIRAGITGKEADAYTRDVIREKGYGDYFGHSTGHGLGLEVHESPRLSHLSNTRLVPGMVVTVEPGIYLPNVGGCRIEDDIVITEDGNERLTTSDKTFIQL